MDATELTGLIIALTLLGFIIGFALGVPVHELGHLLLGHLSGYRFLSFRVMTLLWTRDARGRLTVARCPRINGVLGQCLMIPPEDERHFRFVWYNLGGGIFNIVIGTFLVLPVLFLDAELLPIVFLGAGFSHIFFGLLNIFPKRSPLPNDGTNVREARKSPAATHAFYLMLKVNADMAKGMRMSDYPADAFAADEREDRHNFLVASLDMLRATQLEENHRFRESYDIFLALTDDNLPPYYEAQVELALFFHELVYFGDEASVERARARGTGERNPMFDKLLQLRHPAFLPYLTAKVALLEGDFAQARVIMARTRTLLPTLKSPGLEHSVTLMLGQLEKKMGELDARS